MGVFEEQDFTKGSSISWAASPTSFTIIGGGHTASGVEKLGMAKDFTHISSSSGACIEFLTDTKIPVVNAL